MIHFENYTIRSIEITDIEPYFHLVDRNRKRLEDFFTGTTSRTKDIEETKEFLSEIIKKRDAKQYYPFLLIDNSTGDFISFIDLKNIDWTIPKTEIGFFTDKKYAGIGLTTKAMKLFIDHCFAHFEFKKIFLRTHHSNKAALVLADKCGFEKEGVIKMDYKTTSGKIVDLIYFGRLNPSI